MAGPIRLWFLLLLVAVGCVTWPSPAARAGDAAPQRIVFLGDSITDGNTYPLLIGQALREAGKPVPACINAGVAGDTAAAMRKRIDRDVLPRRPTLVSISVGINDVLHHVKVADFEADLSAVAEQLEAKKIPMLVLTTTVLGPKHAAEDRQLDEFNAALRRVAGKHGYKVAEVNRLMRQAAAGGKPLLEEDNVHLTFEGYRLMTRAVLDALGHKDVPVPAELKVGLVPGVIREWHLRPTPDKEPPLDEKAVRSLKPGAGWKAYRLPETEPLSHWWMDQERRRGFALSLAKLVGPAKSYQGVAYLDEKEPTEVFFNTGGPSLESVWLNGKRIFHSTGWTGWHAGKERIPARLNRGRNTVVIETGGQFFLSVTKDADW